MEPCATPREGARPFGFRGFAHLAGAFSPPWRDILDALQATRREDWADIRCGTGLLTIPLAARARKVYGLDTDPRLLVGLGKRIERQRLRNIEVKLPGDDRLPLADRSLDGALLALGPEDAATLPGLARELARVLKDRGRVLVIALPPIEFPDASSIDMVAARAGLRLEQTFQWPGSPFRWRTHAAEGRLYRKTGTPGQ